MAGSFQDELLNGLRSAWCTVLQNTGNFLDALPDPIVESGDVPIARLNRWLYRQFCNREPPAAPTPPFSGGQCPTMYDVTLLKNAVLGNGDPKPGYPDSITVRGMGPVEGFIITQDPGSVQVIFVVFADGNDYAGNLNLPDEEFVNCAITNIVRLDGLPDNCGDPPPETPPPEPDYNDIDVDIEYSPDVGADITVPVNFTFAPVRVNIRGEATIPINIDVGGVNAYVNGEFNLNTGDITFNFGNRNYGNHDKPKPDDYGTDDNLPDNPDDVPDDVTIPLPDDDTNDPVSVIRGVIVTVTETSNVITTIIQNDNPDIYAPNLGYVQFAIPIGRNIAWTSDIPVKNKRNFIPCPWEGGALDVRGTPRPGVTWVLTPVYLEIEKPLPLFP